MTDPAPFLSTTTGASAGLVAIVGGLLVARFIGLDSEQQGTERALSDAQDRLRKARERMQVAADRFTSFEAFEFLSDPDVLNKIGDGCSDVAELRRVGPPTPLPDDP